MKSFFQRKHSSGAAQPKSASSKDPYRTWEPRPDSELPQRASGRSEKRDDKSSSRKPTERHRSSSRAPRQNGDSVPPYAPSTSTYKHAYTGKDTYVSPTATASTSNRTPLPSSSQSNPRPNPSMDASTPSHIHVNAATSIPYPSVEVTSNLRTNSTSAMNGAYATSSAPGPEIPAKANSSSSRRLKEREREREVNERHGDRSRQRERDREWDKSRDKDGEGVRERERTRDREREREREARGRERERERERERTKRLHRETGSVVGSGMDRLHERDAIREKERQRDRETISRSSAKERDKIRERDYPRDYERRKETETDLRARDKVQYKDSDRTRERSRRPSDLERDRALDKDRSNIKSRKLDSERDTYREPNYVSRPAGKESSDEGESSDVSKRNHTNIHRRVKAPSSVPWIPSVAMNNSLGPTLPYAVPTTSLPTRAAQEPAASIQAQQTPQPLPVYLPLKLPDPKPIQDPLQPQDATGNTFVAPVTENIKSRRMERHTQIASRVPSQDKESGLTNASVPRTTVQQQQMQKTSLKAYESLTRAYGDDRQARYRLKQVQDMQSSVPAPLERERTNTGITGNQSAGNRAEPGSLPLSSIPDKSPIHSASEDAPRLRPDTRTQYPHINVSHRHEAGIPIGLPTPTRPPEQVYHGESAVPVISLRPPHLETSSASQQASTGVPLNRRDKEQSVNGRESKQKVVGLGINEQSSALGKDARQMKGSGPLQVRGNSDPTSSSHLFLETPTGNTVGQFSISVPNNSPQISVRSRMTPPTPVKQSPSTETGPPLSGHGRLNSYSSYVTNSPIVSGRLATPGAPAIPQNQSSTPEMYRTGRLDVSATPSYTPHKLFSQEHLMVPSSQRPSSKVPQLVAGYEARWSPSTARVGSVAPELGEVHRKPDLVGVPTRVSSRHSTSENQQGLVGGAVSNSPAPMQSSPSFNVSMSTNERGRVISFSASNEDGSPARNASTGSHSGQIPTLNQLPGVSDTPSSKHTMSTPMSNVTNVFTDTNQSLGKTYPATGGSVGTRGREEFSLNSVRPGMEHSAPRSKIVGSGAPNSRAVRSTSQNAVSVHNGVSGRNEEFGGGNSLRQPPAYSPFVQASTQSAPPINPGVESGVKEANGSRSANASLPGMPRADFPRHASASAFQSSDRNNDTLWQAGSRVEPIERPSSTLPFRHPKLVELLSDDARPSYDSSEVLSPGTTMPHSQSQPRMFQERQTLSSTRKILEATDSTIGLPATTLPHHSPTSFSKDPQIGSQAVTSQRQDRSMETGRNNESNSLSHQYSRIDGATNHYQPSPAAMAYTTSSPAAPVSSSDPYTNVYGYEVPMTSTLVAGDIKVWSDTSAIPPRPSSTRPAEGAWINALPPRPSSTRPAEGGYTNASPTVQPSPYSSSRRNVRAHEPTGSTRSRVSQSDVPGQKSSAPTYPSIASYAPPSDALRVSLPEKESDHSPPSSTNTKEATQPTALPPPRSSPHKIPRVPSEESILKTPSSLAPSNLKPTTSRTSIPASLSSQQESRKKGFLSIFRPRTLQQQDQGNSYENSAVPGNRHTGREIPLKFGPANILEPDKNSLSSRAKVPPPINVPIPITTMPDRKSPNHKVFTPFRYLTVKRNRTMSAASVEAVDGTAPNTVVGSPTASMHSSQPPIQPPPLRDAHLATQEWRERKEVDFRSTRHRVQRPGVVFDVPQEPSEDKQNLKYVKTRGSRPSTSSR